MPKNYVPKPIQAMAVVLYDALTDEQADRLLAVLSRDDVDLRLLRTAIWDLRKAGDREVEAQRKAA